MSKYPMSSRSQKVAAGGHGDGGSDGGDGGSDGGDGSDGGVGGAMGGGRGGQGMSLMKPAKVNAMSPVSTSPGLLMLLEDRVNFISVSSR